ncbi:cation diffusion facilitator family transporter [Tautonia sociabilis]|uniref:Cation transporter n=1 Tax=Tautonia sociabilis TaxID=2080755 RepID=A0A432MFW3_9BACT|nr:cation diffusion facilitator family transporter [Tautonia sociabilis]RUL85366.1 cation transporter [Tautonia sociabilis]
MPHSHDLGTGQHGRAFAVGVALNVAFVLVEAGFGLWANSLALLADAGHNLSDVIGLLLAWGGAALARIRPTERHTYGWRGSSILAALFNGLILLVAVGGIAWEAMRRLFEPVEPAGLTIVVVAAVGVVINTATALLFLKGRERDLNIRGAFLHMAADAGVSVGVVVAGLGIRWTGWAWIDPATSLVIAVVIFSGTWGLLRESFNLAMQAVPEGIDPKAVRSYLEGIEGVEDVHDLHIWAMSTTEVALTAHLLKPGSGSDDDDELLSRIGAGLHDRFGIEHATIQVERRPPGVCGQAGQGAV